MATLEEIKEKLALIQKELTEVYKAIEQLENNRLVDQKPQQSGWPASIQFADKELLRQAFHDLIKQMGIEHVKPIGAVTLQEMMLKEGVKPEDNLFSRGIIEMREE